MKFFKEMGKIGVKSAAVTLGILTGLELFTKIFPKQKSDNIEFH